MNRTAAKGEAGNYYFYYRPFLTIAFLNHGHISQKISIYLIIKGKRLRKIANGRCGIQKRILI